MTRSNMIEQLEATPHWDIIVIGGGATGVGAAVDAAARGYKTLLLEQYDFGKGTSSKSTKLIHGGVRYLQQGNIRLVRDALRERGLLLKNAPHVCGPLSLITPSYRWWEKAYYGIGLKLYNFLSGPLSLGETELLSKAATLECVKGLNPKRLGGSVVYTDGQFDDTRLCINLVQTAAARGACMLNYAKVVSLIKEQGRVVGVCFEDAESGKKYSPRATVVINATGAFVDDIIRMDEPDAPQIVTPSQGIHIVIDATFFPGKHALLIPRTDDGRVLFAIPWHGKVVVGTTDHPIDAPVIEPRALSEEIDFIIAHFNRYVQTGLTRNDVRSVFAGLRPLVKVPGHKKTAVLPRDHTIWVSKSKMVSVSGGKWTTYRKMAQETVLKAHYVGKLPYKPCQTENLRIHGALEPGKHRDRLDVYGSDAAGIRALQQEGYETFIHPRLPYTTAEVLWMTRNEMAITVEDILARRTRSLFLDAAASVEAAPLVASIMSKALNKSAEWEKQQVDSFAKTATYYML